MPFNFFHSKSAAPKITDLIWLNADAKQKGFVQLLEQYPSAVIAAWFNETITRFLQILPAVLPKKEIRNIRQLATPQVDNRPVILLEHYPLFSREEQLMQHWKAAGIYVLNSLDEPLFSFFGGENITPLLQKMGMQENESIEHPMVSKALKNAQQKLDKLVITEHGAASQQEWFRRNIPAKH